MGLYVLSWTIPLHCPLPLGCVGKTVCSNDGTLTFEGFYFCYPQNNHSHLFVLYVKPPVGFLAAGTSLLWVRKNKVPKMSYGIHRIIWGLSGTMETQSCEMVRMV